MSLGMILWTSLLCEFDQWSLYSVGDIEIKMNATPDETHEQRHRAPFTQGHRYICPSDKPGLTASAASPGRLKCDSNNI